MSDQPSQLNKRVKDLKIRIGELRTDTNARLEKLQQYADYIDQTLQPGVTAAISQNTKVIEEIERLSIEIEELRDESDSGKGQG